MKRLTFSCLALLVGVAAGCGKEEPTPPTDKCAAVTCSNGQSCDATDGMCKNPSFPSIASAPLIDRMGRPGVNTALTNPFDVVTMFNGQAESGDATKARYNKDGNPATWVATWAPTIKTHLGAYDALDKTCMNQLAYGALTQPNYTTLSQILAGDALQVDTSKTTCNVYLGAEIGALTTAADCGGRTLTMDVIDITYGALVNATTLAANPPGISDGITMSSATASATFPFMANPL
jgi:hypothetical protein